MSCHLLFRHCWRQSPIYYLMFFKFHVTCYSGTVEGSPLFTIWSASNFTSLANQSLPKTVLCLQSGVLPLSLQSAVLQTSRHLLISRCWRQSSVYNLVYFPPLYNLVCFKLHITSIQELLKTVICLQSGILPLSLQSAVLQNSRHLLISRCWGQSSVYNLV